MLKKRDKKVQRLFLTFNSFTSRIKIALLIGFFGVSAIAGDLYVTRSGSGDGSSWDQALGDIQRAINLANKAEPKKRVHVAGGTYHLLAPLQVPVGVEVLGSYHLIGDLGSRQLKPQPAGPWDFESKTRVTGLQSCLNMGLFSGVIDGIHLESTHRNGWIEFVSGTIKNSQITGHGLKVLGQGTRVLEGCKVYDNSNGGISNYFGSTVKEGGGKLIVEDCHFVEIDATVCGILFLANNKIEGVVNNCLFADNTIADGLRYKGHSGTVGAYGNQVKLTISNSTVINNQVMATEAEGAGVFSYEADVTVFNSIIWANSNASSLNTPLMGKLKLEKCAVNKQDNLGGIQLQNHTVLTHKGQLPISLSKPYSVGLNDTRELSDLNPANLTMTNLQIQSTKHGLSWKFSDPDKLKAFAFEVKDGNRWREYEILVPKKETVLRQLPQQEEVRLRLIHKKGYEQTVPMLIKRDISYTYELLMM